MSYLFKLMLLGDPIKEKIRERYLGKNYSSSYEQTMRTRFGLKEMDILGKSIKFQTWDLVDRPGLGKMNVPLYYGSLGALIIYKTGDRESFDDIKPWLNELWEYNGHGRHIFVILAGFQEDLVKNVITKDEIQALIQEVQSPVFPISDYIIPKGDESKMMDIILQQLGGLYLNFIESFKTHKMRPILSYAESTITDIYSTLAQQTDTVAHKMVQKIESHRTHQYRDGNPFAYAFTIRELEYLVGIYQINNPKMADSIKDSIELI
ncbi:MAG: hypothetical protein ACW964_18315 [Candidatus Hodarchaeales archaeon]|jgi:GTPase SAR1 family protein